MNINQNCKPVVLFRNKLLGVKQSTWNILYITHKYSELGTVRAEITNKHIFHVIISMSLSKKAFISVYIKTVLLKFCLQKVYNIINRYAKSFLNPK